MSFELTELTDRKRKNKNRKRQQALYCCIVNISSAKRCIILSVFRDGERKSMSVERFVRDFILWFNTISNNSTFVVENYYQFNWFEDKVLNWKVKAWFSFWHLSEIWNLDSGKTWKVLHDIIYKHFARADKKGISCRSCRLLICADVPLRSCSLTHQ